MLNLVNLTKNVKRFINLKLNQMDSKVRVTLLARGIKVTKICKNDLQIQKFERDMPAKYNLLFTSTPYIIGYHYITD